MRSFHHSEFPLELLRKHKREPVTVVLPAREVADTIGPIVERLTALGTLVDQVLVVDADSRDGTAELAASLGADVRQEAELVPELGPPLGKGDAMWRALSAVDGEIVVYLDSDTQDFPDHFVTGMLGPLLCDPGARFVKGAFRRPFTAADGSEHPRGGRVTELLARPLLSAFYPDLAPLVQPLAGEIAARRELLEWLPFATGYAVEMSMLLHARALLGGATGIVQVDLDVRRQRHQSLDALRPMAHAVLGAVLERLRAEGRLSGASDPPSNAAADDRVGVAAAAARPPFRTVRAAA